MAQSGNFFQECPVCGRPLSIPSIYLEQRLACQHCGGRFLASKAAVRNGSAIVQPNSVLQRAEQLIDRLSRLPPSATGLVAVGTG
jgi:DNA-directed RNA polymerase subunit RPC12/RpoP